MNNSYKSLHVATSIILNTMLLVITFSTNSPIILLCILLNCILVFASSGNLGKIKTGLIMFIPFSAVTIFINMIFVQQGRTIMFSIGSRSFSLEALIYAFILSLKLLLVVYIFSLLGIMMDSDKAVSYFSRVLPKTTLTFMIALKLFPIMKRRLQSLKEIYTVRGIDFSGKGMKNKVISYMPMLSILLEDSLEKSFDIGEAAYVRGFLSSKRSVYERQRYKSYDYVLIITTIFILLAYLTISILGLDSYDIYNYDFKTYLINKGSLLVLGLFIILFTELSLFWRKLVVTYEIY